MSINISEGWDSEVILEELLGEEIDTPTSEELDAQDRAEGKIPRSVREKSKDLEVQRERRRKRKIARETGVFPPRYKKTMKRYRRRDMTPKDVFVLKYLSVVTVASSAHFAQTLGVKNPSTRLCGLREYGAVKVKRIETNGKSLWQIAVKGVKTLKERGLIDPDFTTPSNSSLGLTRIMHELSISQVISHRLSAWKKKAMEQHGITDEKDDRLFEGMIRILDNYIDEQTVRKMLTGSHLSDAEKARQIDDLYRKFWLPLASQGRFVEAARTCPAALTPRMTWRSSEHKDKYRLYGNYKNPVVIHIPDMMINREHLRKSIEQPTSIAIEIELTSKKKDSLRKIIDIYVHCLHERKLHSVLYYHRGNAITKTITEIITTEYPDLKPAEIRYVLDRFRFQKIEGWNHYDLSKPSDIIGVI